MALQLADLHPLLRNLTWKDFDPSINCTWAGQLLGQWFRWDLDDDFEGTSYYLISSFAWACSPVPLVNVSRGQIVDWDIYQMTRNISSLDDLTNRTKEACFGDFCQHLKGEGNPDLAGIGVFAAYVMQAIFTMGFLITYLSRSLIDWRRRGKCRPSLPAWKRLDKCLGIFWNSSFYFSLCILIASLSITYLSNNSEHAVYFSFFGSIISVGVLGTLWPWYQSRCTHPHLALTGFSVLFILIAAISASSFSQKPSWETPFELWCFYEILQRSTARYLLLTPILTVSSMVVWWGSTFWYERLVRKRQQPFIARWARGAMSLTSFILLWVCLGYFIQLRTETSNLIGNSYAENEWGFGQILAVIAWIPTCAEFAKVFTWDYIDTRIAPKIRSLLRLQAASSKPNTSTEYGTGEPLQDIEVQKPDGTLVTTTTTEIPDSEAGALNDEERRLIPQPWQDPSQSELSLLRH
ncbi:hypothetical protein V8F06_014877 [Rhypophila decipiens]